MYQVLWMFLVVHTINVYIKFAKETYELNFKNSFLTNHERVMLLFNQFNDVERLG